MDGRHLKETSEKLNSVAVIREADFAKRILGGDDMTDKEIIKALRCLRVETGSLSCLGCGHEHSCNVHGCQILREAAARLMHLLPTMQMEETNE